MSRVKIKKRNYISIIKWDGFSSLQNFTRQKFFFIYLNSKLSTELIRVMTLINNLPIVTRLLVCLYIYGWRYAYIYMKSEIEMYNYMYSDVLTQLTSSLDNYFVVVVGLSKKLLFFLNKNCSRRLGFTHIDWLARRLAIFCSGKYYDDYVFLGVEIAVCTYVYLYLCIYIKIHNIIHTVFRWTISTKKFSNNAYTRPLKTAILFRLWLLF